MVNYNRNQLGPYNNSDQEWSEKLNRRREDIYGEGERRPKDFDLNQRPLTFPARETTKRHPQNESVRSYHRNEYFGSPYDVGNYASHYDERAYNPEDQRISFKPEESRTANFKGKGPRSYMRADKRILEDVNDLLFIDPYLDASEIEVDVDKGNVILKGIVDDRNAKRRAEDITETVPGVKNVENRIRIRASDTNERIVGPVRSNAREELM